MKRWQSWFLGFSITIAVGVVYIALAGLAANRPVVINQTAVPPLPTLNVERIAQGEPLYVQYCAQCHGLDLKGSPTWKELSPDGSLPPPPHDSTGHTWHHSDELLLSIVASGGDPAYNSKMPTFKDKLTEGEMVAILEFIKSNWNREEREFQWWITSRPNLP